VFDHVEQKGGVDGVVLQMGVVDISALAWNRVKALCELERFLVDVDGHNTVAGIETDLAEQAQTAAGIENMLPDDEAEKAGISASLDCSIASEEVADRGCFIEFMDDVLFEESTTVIVGCVVRDVFWWAIATGFAGHCWPE